MQQMARISVYPFLQFALFSNISYHDILNRIFLFLSYLVIKLLKLSVYTYGRRIKLSGHLLDTTLLLCFKQVARLARALFTMTLQQLPLLRRQHDLYSTDNSSSCSLFQTIVIAFITFVTTLRHVRRSYFSRSQKMQQHEN